jgi:hypothetical protein
MGKNQHLYRNQNRPPLFGPLATTEHRKWNIGWDRF